MVVLRDSGRGGDAVGVAEGGVRLAVGMAVSL